MSGGLLMGASGLVVGGGDGAASGDANHEFYRPLENVTLVDPSDEFDTASLDPLWGGVYIGNVLGINDGPVDAASVPAAGHYRITPNYRGSWAAIRPPGGGSCNLRYRVAANAAFQMRARFGGGISRISPSFPGPAVATANCYMSFNPELAGQPDFGNTYIRMGWLADSGSGLPFLQFFQRDGGAFYVTNYPEAASGLQRIVPGSGEFVLAYSGAGSWIYGFQIADGPFIRFPTGAGFAVGPGQPMWITIQMSNPAVSGVVDDGLWTHYLDYTRKTASQNLYTP